MGDGVEEEEIAHVRPMHMLNRQVEGFS